MTLQLGFPARCKNSHSTEKLNKDCVMFELLFVIPLVNAPTSAVLVCTSFSNFGLHQLQQFLLAGTREIPLIFA